MIFHACFLASSAVSTTIRSASDITGTGDPLPTSLPLPDKQEGTLRATQSVVICRLFGPRFWRSDSFSVNARLRVRDLAGELVEGETLPDDSPNGEVKAFGVGHPAV